MLVVLLTALCSASAAPQPECCLLNVVEGEVQVDGLSITSEQLTPQFKVSPGSHIRTDSGRAEVLLAPGVFLRLGENAEMELRPLNRVVLLLGKLMVDRVEAGVPAQVYVSGAVLSVTKPALCEVQTDLPQIRIYDGHAAVEHAARTRLLKKAIQISLPAVGRMQAHKFNSNLVDSLYAWSSRMCECDAAANYFMARQMKTDAPASRWDWGEPFRFWAFVPHAGSDSSGFGYSFSSPWDISQASVTAGLTCGHPVAYNLANRPRWMPDPALINGTLDLSKLSRFGEPAVPPPGAIPISLGPLGGPP